MNIPSKHLPRQPVAESMAFRFARTDNDHAAAWAAFERARMISHSFLALRPAHHWAIFGFAFSKGDWREARKQIIRLVLAPLGAMFRRIPVETTGHSTASAFQSIPIPDDLETKLIENDR